MFKLFRFRGCCAGAGDVAELNLSVTLFERFLDLVGVGRL